MRTLFIIIPLYFLYSCSTLDLPIIYKSDVNQGYVLDEDKIEKLEIGMSKNQTRRIIGHPTIIDPFHKDKWYYINYSTLYNKDDIRYRLVLEFKEDALSNFYTDNDLSLTNDKELVVENSITPKEQQQELVKEESIIAKENQEELVIENSIIPKEQKQKELVKEELIITNEEQNKDEITNNKEKSTAAIYKEIQNTAATKELIKAAKQKAIDREKEITKITKEEKGQITREEAVEIIKKEKK
jgi:outer membrane protein assembly factor BamE